MDVHVLDIENNNLCIYTINSVQIPCTGTCIVAFSNVPYSKI